MFIFKIFSIIKRNLKKRKNRELWRKQQLKGN